MMIFVTSNKNVRIPYLKPRTIVAFDAPALEVQYLRISIFLTNLPNIYED